MDILIVFKKINNDIDNSDNNDNDNDNDNNSCLQ